MISLLRYAKDYRKQIILGPFFKFLEAVFELVLPLQMAALVDEGLRQNNWSKVLLPIKSFFVIQAQKPMKRH